MKKHFAVACLLLAGAVYAFGATPHTGCTVAPGDLPTQRIVDDMHRKDTVDVVSLYDTHAVFIDPNGKRFRGAAALQSLYEGVFTTMDSDIVMTGREWRSPDPNTCIEIGRYQEHLRIRATGATQYYEGGYRLTYKKQLDGSWRISRQEWINKP